MDRQARHRLLTLLERAAAGRFPPVDGAVEVVAPERAGRHAIVEFTGHAVVVTDRSPDDPLFEGVDAFGGVGHPDFVTRLAGSGASIGSHDVVLVRRGAAGAWPALARTERFDDHERVLRSRHHRSDVVVFGDDDGLVTVGSGLVGRTEMSVELVGGRPGSGSGRRLIRSGLATIPDDRWVFAQVAPGNAASLRAFLACGFVPIGSEILVSPGT